MKNLTVILGKTFSGKTTLLKDITENTPYQRVLTHTTRPPRIGEKDGRDYYFEKQIKSNTIALRKYHVINNQIWAYWSTKEDLANLDYPLMIIDHQGFKDLVAALPDFDIQGIYLNINSDTLLKRIVSRESNRTQENKRESTRRLVDDTLNNFKDITKTPHIITANNNVKAKQLLLLRLEKLQKKG